MIDRKRLFDDLPSPYMVLDRNLRFIDMNARYLATTERTREELLGRYVFEAFPERGERLLKFKSAFEAAVAGRPSTLVREPFSIARPAAQGGGRREVYWTCHHLPVFAEDGAICGVAQKAEDVTSEVTAELMRDVIAREFNHRVGNLLATVNSVARITAHGTESKDAFLRDFYSRIDALGRTHALLLAGSWQGTDMAELVHAQLSPYRSRDAPVEVGGPALALTARQTQALGMAFHELATNAARYGAFQDPTRRISVSWELIADPAGCRVSWFEAGAAAEAEEKRSGFGSKILTRAVPMELNGTVDWKLLPEGLRYEITFPLG